MHMEHYGFLAGIIYLPVNSCGSWRTESGNIRVILHSEQHCTNTHQQALQCSPLSVTLLSGGRFIFKFLQIKFHNSNKLPQPFPTAHLTGLSGTSYSPTPCQPRKGITAEPTTAVLWVASYLQRQHLWLHIQSETR